MKTYTIKITGEGTASEISSALQLIVNAIEDKRIRVELDSPKIEDLDGCEWEDCTLMTEINLVS